MKREILNECRLSFPSLSVNESYARAAAAAFAAQADPTVREISEIKTAVSEAVTNAIVHGYRGCVGTVELIMRQYPGGLFYICVRDKGAVHHRAGGGAQRSGVLGYGELHGPRERQERAGKGNFRHDGEADKRTRAPR